MDNTELTKASKELQISQEPLGIRQSSNIFKKKLIAELPGQSSKNSKIEDNLDLEDDEISQQMTQSYSEISIRSGLSPEQEIEDLHIDLDSLDIDESHLHKKRPVTLSYDKFNTNRPLNLDGTVRIEGNMTHFVVEDLENKLKLSSSSPIIINKKNDIPITTASSRSGTPNNTLYRQILDPHLGQIDAAFIADLECESHRMATSVDNLIENLSGILHSISSITADNVDIYNNAVSKMSDAMDGNIKSMYTMMAKAEEITQNMKTVEVQAAKIKEIKKLVDLFESFL